MPVRRLRPRAAAGLIAAAALLALGVAGAGPAAAGPPDFGTGPVSGPGRVAGSGSVSVQQVTVGRHDGYDRVVFRAEGGLPSWEVRYVSQITRDPSDEPVPLRGGADVLVILRGTDWTRQPSVQVRLTPGFPALKEVAGAGEFEGVLSYGLGQATGAGIRAFALTGPDRLVVDVAQAAATAPIGLSASPSAARPGAGTGAGAGTGTGAGAGTGTGAGAGTGTGAGVDTGTGASGQLAETGDDGIRSVLLVGAGLLVLGALTLTAATRHVRGRR